MFSSVNTWHVHKPLCTYICLCMCVCALGMIQVNALPTSTLITFVIWSQLLTPAKLCKIQMKGCLWWQSFQTSNYLMVVYLRATLLLTTPLPQWTIPKAHFLAYSWYDYCRFAHTTKIGSSLQKAHLQTCWSAVFLSSKFQADILYNASVHLELTMFLFHLRDILT